MQKSKQILLTLLVVLLFASCKVLKDKHNGNSNRKNCIESENIGALIFSDKFDDNTNNWRLVSTDEFLVYINNGVLHVEKYKKNRESNGCLWFTKAISKLNTGNDFKISFDARFVQFDDVFNGIDFQWGNLGDDLYQLSFSINGQIILQRFTQNKTQRWSDITSFVVLDLIKKNDCNKIVIRQIKDNCVICINDVEVINTKIENIVGNQIGFQQCLKVAWEMDNLEIRN